MKRVFCHHIISSFLNIVALSVVGFVCVLIVKNTSPAFAQIQESPFQAGDAVEEEGVVSLVYQLIHEKSPRTKRKAILARLKKYGDQVASSIIHEAMRYRYSYEGGFTRKKYKDILRALALLRFFPASQKKALSFFWLWLNFEGPEWKNAKYLSQEEIDFLRQQIIREISRISNHASDRRCAGFLFLIAMQDPSVQNQALAKRLYQNSSFKEQAYSLILLHQFLQRDYVRALYSGKKSELSNYYYKIEDELVGIGPLAIQVFYEIHQFPFVEKDRFFEEVAKKIIKKNSLLRDVLSDLGSLNTYRKNFSYKILNLPDFFIGEDEIHWLMQTQSQDVQIIFFKAVASGWIKADVKALHSYSVTLLEQAISENDQTLVSAVLKVLTRDMLIQRKIFKELEALFFDPNTPQYIEIASIISRSPVIPTSFLNKALQSQNEIILDRVMNVIGDVTFYHQTKITPDNWVWLKSPLKVQVEIRFHLDDYFQALRKYKKTDNVKNDRIISTIFNLFSSAEHLDRKYHKDIFQLSSLCPQPNSEKWIFRCLATISQPLSLLGTYSNQYAPFFAPYLAVNVLQSNTGAQSDISGNLLKMIHPASYPYRGPELEYDIHWLVKVLKSEIEKSDGFLPFWALRFFQTKDSFRPNLRVKIFSQLLRSLPEERGIQIARAMIIQTSGMSLLFSQRAMDFLGQTHANDAQTWQLLATELEGTYGLNHRLQILHTMRRLKLIPSLSIFSRIQKELTQQSEAVDSPAVLQRVLERTSKSIRHQVTFSVK